ncbi:hypothetical protein EC9_50940 [Rosistilla ulvae]|uniref:Uncharacterized protein n=1 Tax=Rosistilla ulvae TaxID=1930277 RepID=A0A517M7M5_9BACT|nr:hypothetical protein EC9_50940 [Rosistilla ulvae]
MGEDSWGDNKQLAARAIVASRPRSAAGIPAARPVCRHRFVVTYSATTSPFWAVFNGRQTATLSTVSEKKRTDPSAIAVLTPPG